MGGIINFPMPEHFHYSPVQSDDLSCGTSVVSLHDEIENMLTIIFALKLVHFHWKGDWWWLKFRYPNAEAKNHVRSKPAVVRAALERIHAFFIPKVFERYEESQENDRKSSYFEVKKLEDWETQGDYLNIYFRTFRFAGHKSVEPVDGEAPYEEDEYWASRKFGVDDDLFSVRYFYRKVD